MSVDMTAVFLYSWWKLQCWLKAPEICLLSLWSVSSSDVYWHESGRCHSLSFILIFFLLFYLSRFSFCVNVSHTLFLSFSCDHWLALKNLNLLDLKWIPVNCARHGLSPRFLNFPSSAWGVFWCISINIVMFSSIACGKEGTEARITKIGKERGNSCWENEEISVAPSSPCVHIQFLSSHRERHLWSKYVS